MSEEPPPLVANGPLLMAVMTPFLAVHFLSAPPERDSMSALAVQAMRRNFGLLRSEKVSKVSKGLSLKSRLPVIKNSTFNDA